MRDLEIITENTVNRSHLQNEAALFGKILMEAAAFI